MHTNAFCVVTEDHHEALRCYSSQVGGHYVNDEFVLSWDRTRGGLIGESFEVIRWRLL